ncbi:ABC transporter permease subunit, partial [Nocardia farcinica]|uniref:ABC transporter permease subunit n=1 Tax=Nocardia farcinica TaxID=37329 RepID=UPI003CC7D64B
MIDGPPVLSLARSRDVFGDGSVVLVDLAGHTPGSFGVLLAALGLSLTFGQMGVINMAHGEFIMAGCYTTYVVQKVISDAG